MSDDARDAPSIPRTITATDVADDNPRVIANHLRRLGLEMRTNFELLAERLARIAETLEHISLRQEDLNNEYERRLTALEPRRIAKRK